MVLAVLKTSFEKLKPKLTNYRDHNFFFLRTKEKELSNTTLEKNACGFEELFGINQKKLNYHVPSRQKGEQFVIYK